MRNNPHRAQTPETQITDAERRRGQSLYNSAWNAQLQINEKATLQLPAVGSAWWWGRWLAGYSLTGQEWFGYSLANGGGVRFGACRGRLEWWKGRWSRGVGSWGRSPLAAEALLFWGRFDWCPAPRSLSLSGRKRPCEKNQQLGWCWWCFRSGPVARCLSWTACWARSPWAFRNCCPGRRPVPALACRRAPCSREPGGEEKMTCWSWTRRGRPRPWTRCSLRCCCWRQASLFVRCSCSSIVRKSKGCPLSSKGRQLCWAIPEARRQRRLCCRSVETKSNTPK